MAQGVELLVDTEEMLVGLDDEKLDSVSVNNCEEPTDGNSVLSPDKQNLVSISVENTPSKNQGSITFLLLISYQNQNFSQLFSSL